jgi:choline kinase
MKRMIGNAARSGMVSGVTIVVGYEKAQVTEHARGICEELKIELNVVENPHFATTNTSKSVLIALRERTALNDGFILADGDLVCHSAVFNRIAAFPESCAAVDRPSYDSFTCDDEEAVRAKTNDKYLITALGKKIGTGMGESIGLYKLHKDTIAANMDKHLDEAEAQQYYEDGWAHAIDAGEKFEMTSIDVTGYPCVEVDDGDDLEYALSFVPELHDE